MKARIKEGATVGQDHGRHRWPIKGADVDQVFDCEKGDADKRYTCAAPGFGKMGSYGNGALFVRSEDIRPEIVGAPSREKIDRYINRARTYEVLEAKHRAAAAEAKHLGTMIDLSKETEARLDAIEGRLDTLEGGE